MALRHSFQRGDVVLIQFPFSGPGGQKDRPGVVISTDSYHDDWDELLVVAVTSRSPKKVRSSDCELQDWKTEGLHQPSWARSHLATIQRNLVVRRIGTLSASDLSAVENSLRQATGL